MNTKKYIFVTGGVVSSLGKGVASASIGNLLESAGFKINFLKLDPYLNIDPGTMNPFEHGEVFVTNDGAETDLDLGHYERFTSVKMSRKNNLTSGLVYTEVTQKERNGDYLGQTVQVIPHLTNHIQEKIFDLPGDIIICEVGGTVGDIESLPFLEAIRQVRLKRGPENALFIHMTSVPIISSNKEVKTKPTQHSVKELLSIGIQPDILMCRCEVLLSKEHTQKISLFTNVEQKRVISVPDVDFIYRVPQVLYEQHLHSLIIDSLKLDKKRVSLKNWNQIIDLHDSAKEVLNVAIVGKYTSFNDAYKSLHEALIHAATALNIKLNLVPQNSELILNDPSALDSFHVVIIPGGFGVRGTEGKIKTIQYCRENNVPTIGICMGMQLMLIEYFKNALGFKNATSTEYDEDTDTPIFHMIEMLGNTPIAATSRKKGGTLRLGGSNIFIEESSNVSKIYDSTHCSERHRHRYEFNMDYKQHLDGQELKIVGVAKNDPELVELVEIASHNWFIGCQFHPELKSTLREPHPIFVSLLRAGLRFKGV